MAEALTVKTTDLPAGTVGSAYSQPLSASGGVEPYRWTISNGALPAGVTLKDDRIIGTPTEEGTSNFTATVTDAANTSTEQPLTITTAKPGWRPSTAVLGKYGEDVGKVATATVTMLIIGLIVAAIWAVGFWTVAWLWSGACTAVGWVVGFLFGIPRTLQSDATATPAPVTGPLSKKSALQVNTNLEQISDWLTKILVGLGLTQLGLIPGKLHEAAMYIAAGLGGPAQVSFAMAIMVFFSSVGFLGSYLITRLFLQRALQQASESDPTGA